MRWKSTLVLLAAAGGLGAYIRLYELKQPAPEERAESAKRVLSVSREAVTALDLALPAGAVSLALEGAMWRLGPERLRANAEVINGILSLMSPLLADRVLAGGAERPLDLASYGLQPPVGRLTVTAGGAPTTLLFGETTPVERKRYAQLEGKPEVYIIPGSLFDNANRPSAEFRDPLLLRFDAWSADELTVAWAKATVALSRREGDWMLTRPIEDLADRPQVTALLNALGRLAIARVIEEHPAEDRRAALGFDRPLATFALRLHGEPPAAVTATIGKPLPEDASLCYAARSDEPALYAVAKTDVEALLKDPQELRARTCFEFFTSQVRRVQADAGGAAWTIEQVDGQWKDVTAGAALDAERVETFLSGVSDLRLAGFVEEGGAPRDAGLDDPAGTLTIWTADPSTRASALAEEPSLGMSPLPSQGVVPSEGEGRRSGAPGSLDSARDTLPGGLHRTQPQRLTVGGAIPGSTERYGRLDGRPGLVRLPEQILAILQTTPAQLAVSRAPESTASPAGPAGSPSRE
jgi:hypothetical protein